MKAAIKSLSLLVSIGATFAYAQGPQGTIKHVIVVIQENRTPTNLFHEDTTLIGRGAHVVPPNNQGLCKGGSPIPLTGMQLSAFCADPDHSHASAWVDTCDADPSTGQCRMDGACDVSVSQHCSPTPVQNAPYTYALNNQVSGVNGVNGVLDPYFHIAENYGFANWMFQTNQGPSYPAHQFLFSGTSAPVYYNDPGDMNQYWQWFAAENPTTGDNPTGCTAPNGEYVLEVDPTKGDPEKKGFNGGYPCYNHNTLATLLDNATPQVSWRYYAANEGFAIWDAPNAIQDICQPLPGTGNGQDICTGYDWFHDVYVGNPGQVLQDLGAVQGEACDLQQVTWVTPDGNWSDHPGVNPTDAGPSWVAAIVNAVGGYNNSGAALPNHCTDTVNGVQVPYWQDTVVLITWDDWGGFYDDIPPPCIGITGCGGYSNGTGAQYVYGFRVPLIVVSAYAKQGHISGPASNPMCPSYYCHDFGSILNFIEYAFGQNGQPLGGTGGVSPSYDYADWLALDGPNSGCPQQTCPYSLSDFFNFSQQNAFVKITGAEYATSDFLNPSTYFPNYPEDPDDDATE